MTSEIGCVVASEACASVSPFLGEVVGRMGHGDGGLECGKEKSGHAEGGTQLEAETIAKGQRGPGWHAGTARRDVRGRVGGSQGLGKRGAGSIRCFERRYRRVGQG